MSERLKTSGGSPVQTVPSHGVLLGEAFRVWLRIAALSFGGPAGQIAVMHRILVEEFMAAFRDAGALNPLLAGTLGGLLATWVTCALLPLDLPWRPLHRGSARQSGSERCIDGHHGCRRRRDPEPCHLVRHPPDLQGCSSYGMETSQI